MGLGELALSRVVWVGSGGGGAVAIAVLACCQRLDRVRGTLLVRSEV